MNNWASQRQSMAEHFAQRAQNASNYLLSSRASRRLHEEGDEAEEEIERFKVQIEKRFLLSVSNKFYSFPYTELTFDNPFEDQQIADLIGRGIYCLYQNDQLSQSMAIDESKVKRNSQPQSKTKAVLEDLRAQRGKLNSILEMISNRKAARQEQKRSTSKQRKLGYKYGVIKQQEDEELLRKRLYTEPYQKHSGFIVKKK